MAYALAASAAAAIEERATAAKKRPKGTPQPYSSVTVLVEVHDAPMSIQ
jgi:hypothetical protein